MASPCSLDTGALNALFRALDSACALSLKRQQRSVVFARIRDQVARTAGRSLDVSTVHLICTIFPEAFSLSVDKARGGLVIRRSHDHDDNDNADISAKGAPNRIAERQERFEQLLEHYRKEPERFVKRAHANLKKLASTSTARPSAESSASVNPTTAQSLDDARKRALDWVGISSKSPGSCCMVRPSHTLLASSGGQNNSNKRLRGLSSSLLHSVDKRSKISDAMTPEAVQDRTAKRERGALPGFFDRIVMFFMRHKRPFVQEVMLVKELGKQDFGGAHRHQSVVQRQAHVQQLLDHLLNALPELAHKAPGKANRTTNLVYISKGAKQDAPGLRALLDKRLLALTREHTSHKSESAVATTPTETAYTKDTLATKNVRALDFDETLKNVGQSKVLINNITSTSTATSDRSRSTPATSNGDSMDSTVLSA